MKIQNKTKIASILFVLISFVSNAAVIQPIPPGFPIDGGILFALAIGMIYGIKKKFNK